MPTSSSALETRCIAMEGLPKEALSQVASYFQALSEPTRLTLLNLLRGGERSVGELAELLGASIPNTSKHLKQLAQAGLVHRRPEGTTVFYAIADPSVFDLCDVVCGGLERAAHAEVKLLRRR